MRINPSKAHGVVMAPPSKSMAHRLLICGSLAGGGCTISNIDMSQDIKATLGCLSSLGGSYSVDGSCVHVRGLDLSKASDCTLDCNESGSTLRFFIPVAALTGRKVMFHGSRTLLSRPLSVYADIFASQGIGLECREDSVTVCGRLAGGVFEIPGNISSQFVTGLLFVLPLLEEDSRIVLTKSVESRPYIDMTLQAQAMFGVKAWWESDNTLVVPGRQCYKAADVTVEGDWSNGAFLEALNVAGGDVSVGGLDYDSLQGDKVYLRHFEALKNGFATIDISDCPDLGPILLSVAAMCHGGRFEGTARLKIKESNRGLVMCQELAKFGIRTDMTDDVIVVHPGQLEAPACTVCGHNDHRIVMSMATLLSVTGGSVDEARAVRKSFPGYFRLIRSLGIDVRKDMEGDNDVLD